MITLTETRIAAYLTTELAAANLGFPVEARPATSKLALPEDRPVIIAQIEDLPEDVPGSELWLGRLQVYVHTPADVTAITTAHHAQLELFVTRSFARTKAAAVSAVFTDDLRCTDICRVGWKPMRQDTKWHPYLAVTLAIRF